MPILMPRGVIYRPGEPRPHTVERGKLPQLPYSIWSLKITQRNLRTLALPSSFFGCHYYPLLRSAFLVFSLLSVPVPSRRGYATGGKESCPKGCDIETRP